MPAIWVRWVLLFRLLVFVVLAVVFVRFVVPVVRFVPVTPVRVPNAFWRRFATSVTLALFSGITKVVLSAGWLVSSSLITWSTILMFSGVAVTTRAFVRASALAVPAPVVWPRRALKKPFAPCVWPVVAPALAPGHVRVEHVLDDRRGARRAGVLQQVGLRLDGVVRRLVQAADETVHLRLEAIRRADDDGVGVVVVVGVDEGRRLLATEVAATVRLPSLTSETALATASAPASATTALPSAEALDGRVEVDRVVPDLAEATAEAPEAAVPRVRENRVDHPRDLARVGEADRVGPQDGAGVARGGRNFVVAVIAVFHQSRPAPPAS